MDQIIIGAKASLDDYGASLATRSVGQPKKKTIKSTVPFSNTTYDFTDMNGEIYWEDRQLEYVFEMVAETPEKLEEMKIAFAGWVSNVIKQELHDPFIPEYHFIATFDDLSFDDDEGVEKTTAKVTFSAYPYKVANYAKTFTFEIPAGSVEDIYVMNESSHRIAPNISSDSDINIVLAGGYLTQGTNKVVVSNLGEKTATVTIAFTEEVL